MRVHNWVDRIPSQGIALVGVLLISCADTATQGGHPAWASADRLAEIARLEQRIRDQDDHLHELEARLSLLEREERKGRVSDAQTSVESARPAVTPAAFKQEPPLASSSTERLPVVPLPDARIAGKGRVEASSVREQYRAALRLVNEGRFDDALPALSRFVAEHPHDELTDNARYFRGEVHYSQRNYEQAIAEFQGVLARFPGSDTAPDCLFKMGVSHLRLGHRAEARRYFNQVIAQYPNSDAARLAAKEGSS